MPDKTLPRSRRNRRLSVNLAAPQLAQLEAERCLQCKNAKCIAGCPVAVDIPGFVARLAAGDLQAAAEILQNCNALPCVSGRVCPQEKQCEAVCIRGLKGAPVAIGYLERFVADWAMAHNSVRKAQTVSLSGQLSIWSICTPSGLTAST